MSDYYVSNHRNTLIFGVIFTIYIIICAISGIFNKVLQRKSSVLCYFLAMFLAGMDLVNDHLYMAMIFPIMIEIFAVLIITFLLLKKK